MENENGAETTEETNESTDTTTTGSETETENGTTNASEQENTGESPDATNASADTDEILTPEERELRDSLLEGGDKETNNLKSQFGRERKAWEQERAELLKIVDQATSAIAEKSGNGQSNGQSGADDGEPTYYTPSQEFLNEDGTLNLDGIGEWNYRAAQMHQHELDQLKQMIKDLGGDVSGIQQRSEESQAAEQWAEKYGVKPESYLNYKRIQQEQGEMAAFDYMRIEQKEAQGIQAAEAHRQAERGTAPPISNGTPPPTVTEQGQTAEQVAKEIMDMPYGDARLEKLTSVPFDYPGEVASHILRLVAHR